MQPAVKASRLAALPRRSFLTAAWLGWQIESNWADPFLFAVYSIVKPLAGAGILVVMYSIISKGNFQSPIFAYLYLGNAFYQYVAAVMTGVSWAVLDDREHYRTMKYIYIAPISFPLYLMGRGVARFLTGTFSVVITVVFGVLFLKVPLDFGAVNWLLFFVTLLMGVVLLAMMGIILAAVTMSTVRHADFLGDAVAAALFLFSGAIFPLEVLPQFLRWLGYVVPISYWLELLRRSLVGPVAEAFPTFARLSNLELLGILAGFTVFFSLAALLAYRFFEHVAREKGYIDWTSNY